MADERDQGQPSPLFAPSGGQPPQQPDDATPDSQPESGAGTRGSRSRTRDQQADESRQLDETVPGGRYVVDGRVVNAHGEELKK